MRVLKGAEVSAKIKEEVQAALVKCKGEAPKLPLRSKGDRWCMVVVSSCREMLG